MDKFRVGQRFYFCRDYEVIECVIEKQLSNSAIVLYGDNEKTVVNFKRLYLDEASVVRVIKRFQLEKEHKHLREHQMFIEKEKSLKSKVFNSPVF